MTGENTALVGDSHEVHPFCKGSCVWRDGPRVGVFIPDPHWTVTIQAQEAHRDRQYSVFSGCVFTLRFYSHTSLSCKCLWGPVLGIIFRRQHGKSRMASLGGLVSGMERKELFPYTKCEHNLMLLSFFVLLRRKDADAQLMS